MNFVLVLAAYLLGAIPFGLLVTRALAHTDVRAVGSGNIGATNVARAAGKKVAGLVLLLDVLKGLLPTLAARLFLDDPWWIAGVGFAAFVGHCFPVYLGFRGGKGVATALGVILALAPWVGLAGLLTWIVIFKVTRTSSLGSLAAAVVAVALAFFLASSQASAWLVLAMVVIIFARHGSNIRRLLSRQESRV